METIQKYGLGDKKTDIQMGWFNKKDEGRKKEEAVLSTLPQIPNIPMLPELPGLDDDEPWEESEKLPTQLPTFPINSLGDKFSQSAIKEAVSGKKEGEEEVFEADEFAPEEMGQMMQKPPKTPLVKELPFVKGRNAPITREIPKEFEEAVTKIKRVEPIFIRIDKFEEAFQIFEEMKRRISEIDKMLRDIKSIKDEEEKELSSWEKEIQSIKQQIDKIDKDIFSKVG
ncbi:MAG: hypothetical protein KKA64_00530 [Nanoarchaeota archaeon]|nr:hypothetical protein [Nanoarchaeota archaeon]